MLSWEAFKHHLEPIFFVNGLIALPSGSQEGARKKKHKTVLLHLLEQYRSQVVR